MSNKGTLLTEKALRPKILFITCANILSQQKNFGGSVISYRNYRLLSEFCDVDVVFPKKFNNKFAKAYYYFLKRRLYYDNSQIREIFNLIESNKYTAVFFDYSVNGNLVKLIKRNFNLPAISFFHNIEKFYYSRVVKKWVSIVEHCEKQTIKFSDKLLLLNKRDIKELKSVYNIKNLENIVVMPVTLKDDFNLQNDKYESFWNDDKKVALFFGSAFPPNYEGIKWFVNEVMPNVDCNLVIAGKGFGQYCDELTRPNVKVFDVVGDVQTLFNGADFFVSPIFVGSGMKVKTCEALKFGKTIFGTDETFIGYDLDFDLVGGKCNTAKEFITKINTEITKVSNCKFNNYSRAVFLEKYEDAVALNILKEIID